MSIAALRCESAATTSMKVPMATQLSLCGAPQGLVELPFDRAVRHGSDRELLWGFPGAGG